MIQKPLLPIDALLPQALESLESTPCLVLQASPGTGKTTRLPPALLGARFRRPEQEILVLEPRRLAAKYAASRVAEEMGETPGRTVGYQFRFESVGSPATRLRFLTEGMLMRKLLGDPELRNTAAVVLDEFHERHLQGDLALGYLRELQRTKRPDLRLVVMSATLDTEAVSTYLGNCPVLRVESRLHPVEIEHLPSPPARHLELTVREAVEKAFGKGGDLLVFLPGMADIRRAADALSALAARGALVLPLHGELTREEQDRAIRPITGKQKIILSTNVAETSLTIEGITTVIDSGLHRQASYSWWSGVPALRTRPISRASAIQRAGRAGRTGPGRCLRLYTQGDFASRAPFETPEIRRADLAQSVLELKALGVADLSRFPWFEAPAAASLEAAQTLLYRLGALSDAGPASTLTALGRRLARIPAHPRLGRLLIEAERQGVLEDAATLAALIGEGALDRLDALECLRGAGADPMTRRARTQLLSAFERGGGAPNGGCATNVSGGRKSAQERLRFAVLTGFPDRVARKRKKAGISAESDLLFSSGGSGRVEEGPSVAGSEFFVTLDIQEQQGLGQARSQVKVRSLCAIEPEWLFDVEPSPLRETEELGWDAERKRVVSVSGLRYDELMLDEKQSAPQDTAAASRVLLKHGLGVDPEAFARGSVTDGIAALGKATEAEALEAAVARLELLRAHFPDFGVTAVSPELLLAPLQGKFALSELAAINWPNELLQQVLASAAPQALGRLEELVPSSIALPSGRRARVQYKLGQPPWVESRMQDFFGMARGPSILAGRLSITLHLLAPNHRAVQVTTDLAGFWERGYQELRTMLSRRYPRHFWPENPLTAEPVSGPRPRGTHTRN
ncbi:MAG: ATP-dependent helicase HrpB [Oligoflexia bacterium]|nr:ATP-dependent helicase HrpB [Oligoflexia bacterium]